MRLIIFLCGLFLVSNSYAANEAASFDVVFGSLTDTKEKTFVSKEYEQLRTIPVSESGKFGFTISPNKNENFKFYTISYLPSSPKKLSGGMSQASPESYSSGIKSAGGTASETVVVRFGFDEGDPLGIYKVDLYVNDENVKSVQFNVVPAK